ncbi:unnamed protein product [Acanthoscelides obtectus]|uniref:Uncharacterized protein n=1 Tax=Acanthoscelides obtectus TaxID=200917 RepID=A0A9P0KFU2_ACAOB|nr:unnamed protein product [Acanthoscelides obtectus]CAK1635720.1 hypothetical protein AOBTE_LOCUS9461 [Acanthoscelides obtectus]
MKQDYDALLTKHDIEVVKNSELCIQIYQQKEDIVSITAKHKEETEKNLKLCERIKSLKSELGGVNKNIKDNREKINTMISDYGQCLESLDRAIKDLERDNVRLKQELENKNSRSQKQELESERPSNKQPESVSEPRKMSFEKQMISMNRLKEKAETLAEELQREKLLKYDMSLKLSESKKIQLQAIEERNQAKNQLSQLQNKVDELAQHVNHFEQQEIQFKKQIEELQFKLLQRETHIKLNVDTIEEVKARAESLKRQLEEADLQKNQILVELSNKNSLCSSLHFQNDNLNHLLEVSSKTCAEFNTKLNEQSLLLQRYNATITNLSQALSDKDTTIDSIKASVAELQQKVNNQGIELKDKEKAFAKLLEENNKLQEIRLLEKDTQNMKETIESGRSTLRALDEDVNDLNHQISDAKGELTIIQSEIEAKIELIYQCNDALSRTFSLLLEKWGNNLQSDSAVLPQIKECQKSVIGLHDLFSNISNFNMMLQTLKSKILSDPADKSLGCQKLQSILADSKTVKKFTLRPVRFSVRSVSPDSSSLETGGNAPAFVPMLNSSFANQSGIKEESIIVNRVSLSPDSQASKSRASESRDSSICEIRSIPEICFQSNFIFPHVTDAFLEKLGIAEYSSTMSLSRPEIEKIFILLASQINLDSVDIQERLLQQQEQCEQYHRNCFCLLNEISVGLREHRCTAVGSLESALDLLQNLSEHFQKTLKSAGQMGMLTCENRMATCWKLVTNYISVLREDKAAIQISRQEKQTDTEDLTISRMFSKPKKSSDSRHTLCDSLKMAFLWTVLLVLFLLGLVAINYHCQIYGDQQICSYFDFFIQRIQLGNPPY